MNIRVALDERLDSILARPKMWGGAEAVELQALLLLEILVCLEAIPEPNEWLTQRYRRYVSWVTSSETPWLLSGHGSNVDDIVRHLSTFRALVTEELAATDQTERGARTQTA